MEHFEKDIKASDISLNANEVISFLNEHNSRIESDMDILRQNISSSDKLLQIDNLMKEKDHQEENIC